MTPHNRILLVVGGAAIIASLTFALVVVETNAADAILQTDQTAAIRVQALGDQLLSEIQAQRQALDEYLLFADPKPLARYRQAVRDEADTAARIKTAVGALSNGGNLSGVAGALSGVAANNDAWRAVVAEPAIAAVQNGSIETAKAAIQAAQDKQSTEAATNALVVQIDALQTGLGARSDALDAFRVAAAGIGVVIELLVAGLSLWFVRRYGMTIERDARRRARMSTERFAIVGSLRTLRMQETPEATAAVIAEALARLPGVDVAGVLECTEQGLLSLAIVGLPGFPIQTGDPIPEARAKYLRGRSDVGPWAERWIRPAQTTAYEERLDSLGIKSQAYAPIQVDGELVGLIALATTDTDHARHLVEDLPAVGEFASVAETILAPALVERRVRAEKRRLVDAIIDSARFHPVFQPIVELATGMTVGFEALTRFDDECQPDLVFAAAVECDMGIELETATLTAALRESCLLPPRAWLSLNVSPAILAQEGTLRRILADRVGSIVLEVTEHEAIDAYAPLREAVFQLGRGVRLAVDDAGAGVANFNHLVELRPHFVKIDVGLVRGVDADASRRAVVVGLVHFAAEAGCEVIAEGIETEAERATVIELGVTLGQGYLLARPAPAETWITEAQNRDEQPRSGPMRDDRVGPALLGRSRSSRPVVRRAALPSVRHLGETTEPRSLPNRPPKTAGTQLASDRLQIYTD